MRAQVASPNYRIRDPRQVMEERIGLPVQKPFAAARACTRRTQDGESRLLRAMQRPIFFEMDADMPIFDKPMSLNGSCTIAGEELVSLCGLTRAELDELVEYGALNAPTAEGFHADVVVPLREASRVRAMFDLDIFTIGLLLQYLSKIEQLECEVRGLRDQLDGRIAAREIRSIGRPSRA